MIARTSARFIRRCLIVFDRVLYMEWAKSHIDDPGVACSLARSSIDHLEPADLGMDLDGLSLTCHTAMGLPALVDALGRRYGIPERRLLLTAGCTLGNFLLTAALVRPGDRVIVERPVYEPLWRNVQAVGGRIAWLRRDDDYHINLKRLDRMLRTPTRLVIFTNLHNPSGRFTPPETVREIGALACRSGARVLWDEVYLDGYPGTVTPAACLDPRTSMSTISLDKIYGLGGLKVGWCMAPPAVIERARRVADILLPCNAPLLERIAVPAVERMDALRAGHLEIAEKGKRIVEDWLARRDDLDWSRPDGGFVGFARFRDG
ncbi:MAG: aminotransferase class I/II-fold pyridoxal phosphate-dependent enzyme, partial [Armatimonadetes bacterium]|nr:aminotransferase class I/II-fold pyridoxal phosphate-dependent enzyme [Armatimonadota bacterium]